MKQGINIQIVPTIFYFFWAYYFILCLETVPVSECIWVGMVQCLFISCLFICFTLFSSNFKKEEDCVPILQHSDLEQLFCN